jgi:hypothetical protein
MGFFAKLERTALSCTEQVCIRSARTPRTPVRESLTVWPQAPLSQNRGLLVAAMLRDGSTRQI